MSFFGLIMLYQKAVAVAAFALGVRLAWQQKAQVTSALLFTSLALSIGLDHLARNPSFLSTEIAEMFRLFVLAFLFGVFISALIFVGRPKATPNSSK